MRKTHKIFSDIPLEIGRRYQTKFATGEFFIVTRIEHFTKTGAKIMYPTAYGIYEKRPHIGECPLSEDRIIHDKKFEREIEICEECGEALDENLNIKHPKITR